MCQLLKKIEAIADPAKDKVLLLLSNLIDDRFTNLSERLDRVDAKIGELTKFMESHATCPVVGQEENTRMLLLLMNHPKLTALIFLGFVALAFTSIGANLQKLLDLFN